MELILKNWIICFEFGKQKAALITMGYQSERDCPYLLFKKELPWKNPSNCAYLAPDGTWFFCWELKFLSRQSQTLLRWGRKATSLN